ncbi:hypothetical protein J6590_014743 [Homalodisca vitripennis]|nr:hypothetical protein J6590_014743 [Homalodisca vitripennis]
MGEFAVFAADFSRRGEGEEHKCEGCGRVYRHYGSLYNHQRFECGKTASFLCTECPFRTKRKGNLTSHFAVKHGNASSKQFN